MIIPIFIPMNNNDDNYDRKHGYGCKCPECLEKEKWDNKPKEYYKYRYAVPFNFILKNNSYRAICWLIGLIGFFVMISSIIFMEFSKSHFFILPLSILLGTGIIISAYTLGDKIIQYDSNCKDKIYIEIKDSYSSIEKWEDKIKELNIPKNYKLTQEQRSWRYK